MRVVILGCGYVGLELARQLRANQHQVVGVRRSDEGLESIESTGAESIRADVTEPDTLEAVPDVDAIVFAASSGGGDATAARRTYVDGLREAIEHFGARDHPPDRLVYTSSTGVYGDHDGAWVDETTPIEPITEKTAVLADAERVAREEAKAAGIDGTVARLAGLYGPDRYRLARYLDGAVTAGISNMVHRDDAAGAIRFLLETDRGRDTVVQVVDDEPVDRWEFADWLADRCGVPRPSKRTNAQRLAEGGRSDAARRRILTSKRCSNEKLRSMGYEFTFPTYREGYHAAIEAFLRDRSNEE